MRGYLEPNKLLRTNVRRHCPPVRRVLGPAILGRRILQVYGTAKLHNRFTLYPYLYATITSCALFVPKIYSLFHPTFNGIIAQSPALEYDTPA
jgi:hypothetical protein